MKRGFIRTVIISLLLAFLAAPAGASDNLLNVVIVFPGGPSAGEEGQRMIGQFLSMIEKEGGLGKGVITGEYFTDTADAVKRLESNPDSFVMGSLGFFLAHRKKLNLAPVAKIEQLEDCRNRYHLVVKKGSFKTPAEMKGKTLSGTTLLEDQRFLSRIVFEKKIDVASHFELKPASRPLSALRKVLRGALDGVLLDDGQYTSLMRMPKLAADLEAIYTSRDLPQLGMMMISTEKTLGSRDAMLKAVKAMCKSSEGRKACETFGIKRFSAIGEDELSEVIREFEEE